jgi:hypothetical protein
MIKMSKRSYLLTTLGLLFASVAIYVPAAALADHHGSGPPQLDPTHAQRLAHAGTAFGSADVDSVPTIDGRTCVALTLPDGPKQGIGNGGMSCGAARSERVATDMNVTMSWVRINDETFLVVYGEVGSAVTHVRLQMPDASEIDAATSNGVYVTRLTAPAIGVLPGAIRATGYDSSNQPVASLDLQKVVSSTPPPDSGP